MGVKDLLYTALMPKSGGGGGSFLGSIGARTAANNSHSVTGVLSGVSLGTIEGDAYINVPSAFTLYSDDLTNGRIVTSPEYIEANNYRVAYIGYDVPVDDFRKVCVTVTFVPELAGETARFGVRAVSQENYDRIIAHESLSNLPDSSWLDNGATYTLPAGTKLLWFSFQVTNDAHILTKDMIDHISIIGTMT